MPQPLLTVEAAKPLYDAVMQAVQQGFRVGGKPSAFQHVGKTLNISPAKVKYHYEHCVSEGMDPAVGEGYPQVHVGTEPVTVTPDAVRAMLIKGPKSLNQICEATRGTIGQILDCIEDLTNQGANVFRRDDVYEIVKTSQPSFAVREPLRYVSRPDNTFVFGACGDQHIGSKYARYDVLDDLYDRFVEAEVDRVFNTGNWIDGDARFNKYDLEVHGLEAQCRLLAERYPVRDGIETFAVWGDDHEGWYAQREGVDVGKYNEGVMRRAGRDDWHDIGFMESHVELVNANTGATAILAVVHPGGGSAYALSYSIQKIVESYEGGEKPNVALYGHYHKLWSGLIRNVWVLQTGCTQDQTVFMRKKRLEAHVGGAIVKLEQDPETGAILSFAPQLIRYFNQDWYVRSGQGNKRWSYTDKAEMAPRSTRAIR